MTDDKIAFRALLEKGSDATFQREMIGFATQRLIELETEGSFRSTWSIAGSATWAWKTASLITPRSLNWLVEDKQITPHIPVIDKSSRENGTFSRGDFRYDAERDAYDCPAGKELRTSGTVHEGTTLLYRASKFDCDRCSLKSRCCPKEPAQYSLAARDVARSLVGTQAFKQSRRDRKRIEMRFAHLKRILRLGRLRLRGPRGAQDEFTLAAIAQNLRRLAKLVTEAPPLATQRLASAPGC